MITLYGIPNCGSVKKARVWLDGHGINHTFVDFKKMPPTSEQLAKWCTQIGWDVLLNRKGTTFRGLSDGEKVDLNQDKALLLMVTYPSLIKRPVLIDEKGGITVGYDPKQYEMLFDARSTGS